LLADSFAVDFSGNGKYNFLDNFLGAPGKYNFPGVTGKYFLYKRKNKNTRRSEI
jgi:hypothetical protein